MYVTLEPCVMCAGAIIQSRIKNLYIGAKDPKGGASGSVINVFENPWNHTVNLEFGIMEEESSKLLKDFFKKLRKWCSYLASLFNFSVWTWSGRERSSHKHC